MFQNERRKIICDTVNRQGSVKVSELKELLNISEVTIRRDLEILDQQNQLVRTHGGAVANYSVGREETAVAVIASSVRIAEKQKIAEIAYTHLNNGETIFMDGSSTVYALAQKIVTGPLSEFRIITTSLAVALLFENSDNADVILLGGELNYKHQNVQGYITNMTIRALRADKCFIGINGIDGGFGYSTTNFDESEQKMEMLKASVKSYILADHTKFGKTYFARVDASSDYVITDEAPQITDLEALTDRTCLLYPKKGDKEQKANSEIA